MNKLMIVFLLVLIGVVFAQNETTEYRRGGGGAGVPKPVLISENETNESDLVIAGEPDNESGVIISVEEVVEEEEIPKKPINRRKVILYSIAGLILLWVIFKKAREKREIQVKDEKSRLRNNNHKTKCIK